MGFPRAEFFKVKATRADCASHAVFALSSSVEIGPVVGTLKGLCVPGRGNLLWPVWLASRHTLRLRFAQFLHVGETFFPSSRERQDKTHGGGDTKLRIGLESERGDGRLHFVREPVSVGIRTLLQIAYEP